MPDAVTHPSPQQLRAYGLGKLSEPARAAVDTVEYATLLRGSIKHRSLLL